LLVLFFCTSDLESALRRRFCRRFGGHVRAFFRLNTWPHSAISGHFLNFSHVSNSLSSALSLCIR